MFYNLYSYQDIFYAIKYILYVCVPQLSLVYYILYAFIIIYY